MHLSDLCLWELCYLSWALYIFFVTSLAMSCVTTVDLTKTLHCYCESFLFTLLIGTYMHQLGIFTLLDIRPLYAGLTFFETCQLGLLYAFTTLVFIHYLKLYLDLRSLGASTNLRFVVETFGFVLLFNTFCAAWSMGLVIYFRFPAYAAQKAVNERF